MDKQYKIKKQFHLGPTDAKNPRDLGPAELSNSTDAIVDEKGTLRTMGSFATTHPANTTPALTISPGRGAHMWGADWDDGGNNVGTMWLAAGDRGTSIVNFYDASGDNWYAATDLGTGIVFEPSYYDYHGGLRITDAGFDAGNTPKLWQYHKRTQFPGTDIEEAHDWWKVTDTRMDPPTAAYCDVTTGSDPNTSNLGIGLRVETYGTIGGWPNTIAFFATYIYEGNQESLPTLIGTSTGLLDLGMKARVFMEQPPTIDAFDYATHYDPRMTGARIYYARVSEDDNTVYETERYLLCEVDIVEGVRATSADKWSAWDDATLNQVEAPDGQYLIYENPPDFETFTTINGFSPEIDSIDIGNAGDGFKTATVINGVVYVGHTCRTVTGGQQLVEPDAVYKSPFGKPDTLPCTGKVTAASNDGESIVKLESYGTMLFQFKEETLYLINTSQGIERKEATLSFHGIANPGAACKTPYGITWINENGAYISDGKQVRNLLERKGERTIKASAWEAFVTSTSIIGYIPQKKQLLIFKGSDGGTTDRHIVIIDIMDQSLCYGVNKGPEANYMNMITDWDNNLMLISGTGAVTSWTDAAQNSTAFDVFFNDDDFEAPGLKKYIYSVTLNYKSTINSIVNPLKYGINGDYAAANSFATKTLATASTWTNAVFTPSSKLGCESLLLRLDINESSTFELNHYIIEYRILPYNRAV